MIKSANIAVEDVRKAANFIGKITNIQPQIALILGSGLGNFSKKIDSSSAFHFSEIPNFPISSVEGHSGKLIFGYLHKGSACSNPLLIFQGRIHFYETGSIEQVLFPILLSYHLGIKKLIITNAAGGISSFLNAGDLMLIQDILNLAFVQLPIPFENSSFRKQNRFDYFDTEMKKTLIKSASEIKLPLRVGSYCWLMGPSYETPAEINMLKQIGADAVGMSTIPEVFLAHSLGIKTVAISLISNLASGISSEKLTHAEVTKAGDKITERFSELVQHFIFSLK